jgi:hypothetical protein
MFCPQFPGSGYYRGPHPTFSHAPAPWQTSTTYPIPLAPEPGVFVTMARATPPVACSILSNVCTPAIPAVMLLPTAGTPAIPTALLIPTTSASSSSRSIRWEETDLPGGHPFPGASADLSWPPAHRSQPIHVAPWLQADADQVAVSRLAWDVRLPRWTASFAGRSLEGDSELRDARIVYPNTAAEQDISVVICVGAARQRVAHARLKVEGGARTRDLLDYLHDWGNESLSPQEYSQFCQRNSDGHRMLYDAAAMRLRMQGGIPEANWLRDGFKRVDMLGADTAYFGAWPKYASGGWYLHVGFVRNNDHPHTRLPRLAW